MSWFLLKAKPREEKRAIENLTRQSVVCFCPMINIERIINKNKVKRTEVLFPGYLFIELEEFSVTAISIRSTRGVSHFVSSGGWPIQAPPELIDQLKTREFLEKNKTVSYTPRPGDVVRIIEGPFRELEAIFTTSDGNDRAIVLLNLLNQASRVSIPYSSISDI